MWWEVVIYIQTICIFLQMYLIITASKVSQVFESLF